MIHTQIINFSLPPKKVQIQAKNIFGKENIFCFRNFFIDIFAFLNYNFYMKTFTQEKSRIYQNIIMPEARVMISMLLNAIHFFLDSVIVIHSEAEYRLIVIHQGDILVDKSYTSLKGAKIAFHKIYRHQACTEDIKAKWDEYIPDPRWLKMKLAILFN